MSRIIGWYHGLPNRWRAALRSAWQAAVGFVLLFVLAVLAEAVDLLDGGTLDETLVDISNAGRIMVIGLVGLLSGLVTLFMNRSGAKNRASYGQPDSS